MRRSLLTSSVVCLGGAIAAASFVHSAHSAGAGGPGALGSAPVGSTTPADANTAALATSATPTNATPTSATPTSPAPISISGTTGSVASGTSPSDNGVPVAMMAPEGAPLGPPYPLPEPFPDECRPTKVEPGEPAPLAPADSTFRRVVGEAGINPGQMVYPRAIACSAEGWVYVVDKRGRIQSFDPELRPRAFVRVPQLIAGTPTGFSFDRDGKLIVADTHYARVSTYTKDLALESYWGRPGAPKGGFKLLADARWGPDGLFYTLDYSPDSARIQVWNGTEVVKVFGRFGQGPGEFQRPMALTIDEKRQEILVADAENHRIQVLRLSDGAYLRGYGGVGAEPGQLKFPYDIDVDEEGRAWVAEFGNHRIQVFDREGHSLATWGSPGRHPGELAEPWGISLGPKGLVYVLDSGNNRFYELERAKVLAPQNR